MWVSGRQNVCVENKMTAKWISSTIARNTLERPEPSLIEQLNTCIHLAEKNGFRVDGLLAAKALVNEHSLARMEKLVFNRKVLSYFKNTTSVSRIEFITEGPLPPELLGEPAIKQENIYRQLIGYDLCKACRLCIEVCPKNVYRDDGTGKPDKEIRFEGECTGPQQCGKCVDICPENTISVTVSDASFASTLYILMENTFTEPPVDENGRKDFYVSNPISVEKPVVIAGPLQPHNLLLSLHTLNVSHFYPVLETEGAQKHLVDLEEPEKDIETWATENSRSPELTLQAVRFLLENLPNITGLKEGKYHFKEIVEKIIDEIIHAEAYANGAGVDGLLKTIIEESRLKENFYGAKQRPIGGLLPPGTSAFWKTPYGDEVPEYMYPEKCLGPECMLCVTNCPEGGGGENSAIKMVPLVPLGVIPSLVRGFGVFVIKLDGSHHHPEDAENLTGKTPFQFVVHPEFCKACGVCMAYCPHEVIEPTPRIFDLRG